MRKDHKIGLQSANNRNELSERILDFQCSCNASVPTRPHDINECETVSEIKSGHCLRYRANIETITLRADQRPVHLFM